MQRKRLFAGVVLMAAAGSPAAGAAPGVGACCLPDGTCLDFRTPEDCEELFGGTYRGDGTLCRDLVCPPFGACCFDLLENCVEAFVEEDCVANGGVFMGEGTRCVDTCPLFGACCLYDGACLDVQSRDECDGVRGDFQGRETTCGEVSCPAFGACCLPEGECVETETAETCGAMGATFFGAGSRCVELAGFLTGTGEDDDDRFGEAIVASPGLALVGAPQDRERGTWSGAVFVVERIGEEWVRTQTLRASDGRSFDSFGRDVDLDGNTAIVGTRRQLTRESVYVFERGGGVDGGWTETAMLDVDGLDAGFGQAVAVDDGVAIVIGEDAAYVFARDEPEPNAWGHVATLVGSDSKPRDFAGGGAVGLAGGTAFVSALRHVLPDGTEGAVYVFERGETVGEWEEVAKLTGEPHQTGALFGISGDIDGDTIVIGAFRADGGAGAAHVFGRNAGGPAVWGAVARLTAPDAEPGDELGVDVDIDGDVVVVGARHDDEADTNVGAAYLFGRDQDGAGAWGVIYKIVPFDESARAEFGRGVAMSGSTVFGGAPQSIDRPGNVRVYDRRSCTACRADLDGDGAVGFGDVLAVLTAWGPCSECPEDLDDSGAVDFADLLIVLAAWGPCP